MQIASVRQLLETLEDTPVSGLSMFRGQTRDWALLPSIGRYSTVVHTYDDWSGFHDGLISNFLKLGHPYLKGYPTTGAESWILGQHYGLPTRLLDTSTNPLKALFFAVNHPADDVHNGVFWIFSYSGWREDLSEQHRKWWDKQLIPFLPAQLNPRLTAQEGAFISYPLPNNCKPLRPMDKFKQDDLTLLKLVVPAAAKATLRRELAQLGIQFRLLFPDLDGVARSIRLTDLES